MKQASVLSTDLVGQGLGWVHNCWQKLDRSSLSFLFLFPTRMPSVWEGDIWNAEAICEIERAFACPRPDCHPFFFFQCGREGSRGLQRSDGGLCCLCEECCWGDVMRSRPPTSNVRMLHHLLILSKLERAVPIKAGKSVDYPSGHCLLMSFPNALGSSKWKSNHLSCIRVAINQNIQKKKKPAL